MDFYPGSWSFDGMAHQRLALLWAMDAVVMVRPAEGAIDTFRSMMNWGGGMDYCGVMRK